jgi:hypothetical protein
MLWRLKIPCSLFVKAVTACKSFACKTTLVPSIQNKTKKRAAITLYTGITNKKLGIFKRHYIDLVYSNSGKLSDVYLKTRKINVTHWKNQVSIKLHVKVVKQNTLVRQKNVPSQDLRSISGT